MNTDHHVHNPCPRCGAPEGENCRPERPVPGAVLCCHIERTDALRTPEEAHVTVQPTRDQLRALADQAARGPWTVDDGGGYDFSVAQGADGDYIANDVTPRDAAFIAAARTAVPHLLDQLAAAEQRIRDLTQVVRDERGAARDQMEQVRIRDARIKAVQDVLDTTYDDQVSFYDIRRALDSNDPEETP